MFEIQKKSCCNIWVAVATHNFVSISLNTVLWWKIIALMLRLGANVSIKITIQTTHSYKGSPDTCTDLTFSLLVISCVVPVTWGSVGVVKSLWAEGNLHIGPTWEQHSDDGASNLWRKGSLQTHPIIKLYSGHNRTPSTHHCLQPGNYSWLFSFYCRNSSDYFLVKKWNHRVLTKKSQSIGIIGSLL